ncbi:FtsK/SpoIIIE domain-containing protein [Mucilaginibacter gotjawali]|uniref:FtsK/SpoIIIE family protein n=2 Tax=Mucilaginibacter gotjawali TaxID=1550579 RepID=A0A0X8X1S6_9SPHI|nr:FtsK/SpoIIIE domain-containing protein [Mucilaginibacter gotjawali]MBB3053798.1 DNA segregation ATPase FtsK/SpoIIIE-like protein [Mucilaginibacter gotjawali]BAU54061.1 FtsK/SpoIIIE family protein [Mucilaginibacter gotjawali]
MLLHPNNTIFCRDTDAVITAPRDVTDTLSSLCREADQRFELLKDAQVRHIKEYNEKFAKRKIGNPEKHRYLPHIVVVIMNLLICLNPKNN